MNRLQFLGTTILGFFRSVQKQEPQDIYMKRVNDTLIELLDSHTGEYVTFSKVTKFADGSDMDNAKCDGVIYRKLGNEYFKRNFTGPVNVKWFGAKGDGVTDDTVAIQKAIDTCGSTRQDLSFSEGRYICSYLIVSKTLKISGRKSVLVSNQDFTKLHYPTIWIAADNCSISGMTFTYKDWNDLNFDSLMTARPSGNSYFGCHISVGYTEMYTLANSGIYNTFRGVVLKVIYNTIIDNIVIHGSALHGISVFNAVNTLISNSTIEQFKGSGILGFITPNFSAKNNKLAYSRDDAIYIGNLYGHLNGVWTPLTLADCKDVFIVDNIAYKIGAKAWSVSGFNNVFIQRNVSSYNRSHAIYIDSEPSVPATASNKVNITDNVLNFCFGGFGSPSEGFGYLNDIVSSVGGIYYAFKLGKSSEVNIINNIISFDDRVSSNYRPLHCDTGKNIVISNNTFQNQLGPMDIGGSGCNNVKIVNNTFIMKSGLNHRAISVLIGLKGLTLKNNYFESDAVPNDFLPFINLQGLQKSIISENTFNNPNGKLIIRDAEGGNINNVIDRNQIYID